VDVGGFVFVQITGLERGQTELVARLNTIDYKPYAAPVPVKVTTNRKVFTLGVSFDDLFRNHPYVRGHSEVCPKGPHNQCMMRFCDTLKRSNVSLKGLSSPFKCPFPGADHAHHFSNPYDFEKWKPLGNAWVWQTGRKPQPWQKEPMPGIAALNFVKRRWKGVIVFYHYFDVDVTKGDMFGGHIDLWNGLAMGNDMKYGTMHDGAFYRSAKIAFWPLARA
jgi:hypothetical protein